MPGEPALPPEPRRRRLFRNDGGVVDFDQPVRPAELGEAAEGLQKQGREIYEHGIEKVKVLASRSDESVRQNPWPYLGGTAIGFLILGFFLSRSSK